MKQLLEECTEHGQVKIFKTMVKLEEGRGEGGGTILCHMPSQQKARVYYQELWDDSPRPMSRHQYLWDKGGIVHHKGLLKQPHMMVVYRGNYNAIGRLKQGSLKPF